MFYLWQEERVCKWTGENGEEEPADRTQLVSPASTFLCKTDPQKAWKTLAKRNDPPAGFGCPPNRKSPNIRRHLHVMSSRLVFCYQTVAAMVGLALWTYRCPMWPTQRRHRWRRRRSFPLITTSCWMSCRVKVLDCCARACVIFHALTSGAVCVGSLSVLRLFMLHAAASSILVLLTFGQPTFKVLFNLSKCCQGSEQHLNNIVAANIFLLYSERIGADDVRLSTSITTMRLYLGFKGKSVYLFLKQMFIIPFYHPASRKTCQLLPRSPSY